jgi:hypothetical protein
MIEKKDVGKKKFTMSVRNECKTKRNSDALKNMKQSLRICFFE